MRQSRLLAISFAVATAFAAPIAAAQTVKIAHIDPFSGPFAPVGQNQLNSWRMVAEIANQKNWAGGPKFEIDNRFIFSKHLSIIGSTMGTQADFAAVMGLLFAGKLKAVIDRTYPLAEAAQAQTRLENNEQMGKITLEIE